MSERSVSPDAEAIEAVLVEHSHHSSAANWTGSPNPGDWHNIRPICRCRQRLLDQTHWTATEVATAHRRHVVAAILWALSGVPTEEPA